MRNFILLAIFVAISMAAHGGLPNFGTGCAATTKCVVANADCNSTYAICDPLATGNGLYCDVTGALGGTNKCQTRKSVGSACNVTIGVQECYNSYCNGSVCTPYPTVAPVTITYVYEGADCNATTQCRGPLDCYAGKCRRRLSTANGANCDGDLQCQGGAYCSTTCTATTKENNIARCGAAGDCDTAVSQQCKCTVRDGNTANTGLCFSPRVAFPSTVATDAACKFIYDNYQTYTPITAANYQAALDAYNCLKTCSDYSLTPLVPSSLVSFSGYNQAFNNPGCTWTTPTVAPSCPKPTTTPAPTTKPTGSASTMTISFVLVALLALLF